MADKEHATIIVKKAKHTLEFINIGCLIEGDKDKTYNYSPYALKDQDGKPLVDEHGKQIKELDFILDICKEESDRKNVPIKIVVIDAVGRKTTINYNFTPLHKLGERTVIGDSLRFAFPFLEAYLEIFKTWTDITIF